MFFQNINFCQYSKSKEKVIFACDELYFKNYGFYNLLSCNNVGHDVHIHLINPSIKFLDKVKKINLNIDLSITTENFLINNINYYKLQSYYFCSRYFIADFLFSKKLLDKAYITDADLIFNEKIFFNNKINLGVLYFPNHDNYWKQSGGNFLYVSKNRSDFLKKIIELYNKKLQETNFEKIHQGMEKYMRGNMYGLDQVCISLQMLNENINSENFLNLSQVDNFISKTMQTKIWSFTGPMKRDSQLQNILLKKFKKSFDE
jgi:hypothetical protein